MKRSIMKKSIYVQLDRYKWVILLLVVFIASIALGFSKSSVVKVPEVTNIEEVIETEEEIIQEPVNEEVVSEVSTYTGQKLTYKLRYPKAEDVKIKVWSWEGGNTIKLEQLEQTITAVILRLCNIQYDKNLVELLLETSATESKRGIYIKQKNGPAKGIYQIEPATITDTLEWLKKNHKDVYNDVQHFWNSKQSDEWNYTKNVPWQTAVAIQVYWRKSGSSIYDLCYSRETRATFHKLVYNSIKGRSSVNKYLQDASDFIDEFRG